jgi:hypothetical protein
MSCGMDVRHLSPVEEAVEEEVAVVGSHASADEMAVERVADSYTPTPAPAGIDFGKWFKPSEDLQQGQVVIIAARWVLVAAGLLLAAWNPAELGELRVQIVLILGLAVANFFLHTRVLMGRPIHATVVYAASAVDIAVVSLIIIAGDGFASGAFVFYFPALLALSVAFKTEATIVFTGAAIAVYGVIATASVITEGDDWATLIARLMMIAGVAVCGNVYWRIERDRRRAAEEAREELKLRVSQATSSD